MPDEMSLIRIEAMREQYVEQNKAVKEALQNGVKFPEKIFNAFISNGPKVYDFCKRGNIHPAVLDHTEDRLANSWQDVQKYMDGLGRPKVAGPKKTINALQDMAPKWKRMKNADSLRHPCERMLKLHNATSEWCGNLDTLKIKKDTVTGNGITFFERDISKICNCQVPAVFAAQREEYMAACEDAKKEIPTEYYITGEPVPVE